MEPRGHIEAIEKRAQAVNLTLAAVCRRTGVRRHVISRWRSGEVSPTIKVFEREIGKLETELCRVERQVYRHLARRYSRKFQRPDPGVPSAA